MTEQKKTTEERLREAVSKETTASLAASFGGNPFYSHDLTASERFLCRELDELRAMASKALGQIGMLGLPEPSKNDGGLLYRSPSGNGFASTPPLPADGEHVHDKVYSLRPQPSNLPRRREWICAECLEEGVDVENLQKKSPTFEELVAKKRARTGG